MLTRGILRPSVVSMNTVMIRRVSSKTILSQSISSSTSTSTSQVNIRGKATQRIPYKTQIVPSNSRSSLVWKDSLLSYERVKLDAKSKRRLKKKVKELKSLIEVEKGDVSANRFFKALKKLPKPIETSVLYGVSKENIHVLLPKLVYTARHSEVAEVFLLRELDHLMRLKDYETVHAIAKNLVDDNKVPGGLLPENTKDEDSKSVISEEDKMRYKAFIVEFALRTSFIEFAYVFVMENASSFIRQPKIVDDLLTALVFKNPLHEELQLDMAFRLREKFDAKFNDFQAGLILEKIPKNATGALQKKISLDVFHNLKSKNADVFLNTVYKSIAKDFEIDNPAGCAESWLRIKHFYQDIGQHDLRIIAKLLVIFNRNRKYRTIAKELINEIPRNLYSHPSIVGPLLDLARELNRPDLANEVCAGIKPPITRSLLSSLLKLHISFNDSEGSEKVLQEIYKMGGDLSASDYNVIISQLLKQDEFVKAMNIVKSIPVEIADRSYITMINHIVDKAIDNNDTISDINLALIDNLIKNIEQSNIKFVRFWDRLAAVYFKYLVSSKSLSDLLLARQIYYNTFKDYLAKSYIENKPDLKSKYDLSEVAYTTNPFIVEDDDSKGTMYLQATEHSKIVILKTIADAAIRIQNGPILNFAMNNLIHSGLSKTELLLDFSRKYSRVVAKSGVNPRKVRSYQLSPEDRLKDIEKFDALNFLKNRKIFPKIDNKPKLKHNDNDDDDYFIT